MEEVIEINKDTVSLTGEPFALTNRALLESAIASPINRFAYGEHDVLTLAIGLLFAIARNHPFQQGNKRTGFMAAIMFLEINGYRLTVADTEFLGECINSVLRGKMTESAFEATLRPFVFYVPDEADLGAP